MTDNKNPRLADQIIKYSAPHNYEFARKFDLPNLDRSIKLYMIQFANSRESFEN